MPQMEAKPAAPSEPRRWLRLTPDRLVLALLAAAAMLWLSGQFR